MFLEKMRLKLLLEIFHEFFRKCMANTSTPYSVIQNFSSKTSDLNDKVHNPEIFIGNFTT